MTDKYLSVACISISCYLVGMNNAKNPLPQGFCYADECGFTCLSDAKYAAEENFTGRQVVGYNAPFVVFSNSLSIALKRAANIFIKKAFL